LRQRSELKAAPQALGLDIQQTAQGFSISKSEGGHTLFVVRASKAVEFKQGGRTELHDVSITLYGRDSSRFDQVYGSDFEYDPQSGDITARGVVQIDLEANPRGALSPDQAPPKELKDPLHLKTSGLVFNQKTGNAFTREKIEFSTPQARGSAAGVTYQARGNALTLESAVELEFNSNNPASITASRGVITADPRSMVLDHPHIRRDSDTVDADHTTILLRDDNRVDRVIASGNVQSQIKGASDLSLRAEKMELSLDSKGRAARTALVSGGVQVDSSGPQPLHAGAGQAVLEFSGRNQLQKVHAEDGVTLRQRAPAGAAAQDTQITAPAMDFFLAAGKHLDHAQTGGPPQIVIIQPGNGQRTVVTADRFDARFGDKNQILSLHGAPSARVVSSGTAQPERLSTSDLLDVAFRPGGGIESIVQQETFAYADGDRKAWADRARYTVSDQVLVLSGSPRITEGGMTTTARTMRVNRTTGDATAEGDVKSTYSDLKAQPGGAMLASSDPIHLTSRTMTVRRSPAVAIYQGHARIWQNANMVEASTIQFDRDARSVVAQSNGESVSTTLEQPGHDGKSTPVAVLATRLTYTDAERKIHLDGSVVAKTADTTMTAEVMDAYLAPRSTSGQPSNQLDRIVASRNVVIQQPSRRATGDTLTYSASDEQFVLSGAPASIFDAEHGKTTGDSLTFFRRDDRVQVKGKDNTPAITTTRVAR
jgi:lipopolysaccharide export system protein LptA